GRRAIPGSSARPLRLNNEIAPQKASNSRSSARAGRRSPPLRVQVERLPHPEPRARQNHERRACERTGLRGTRRFAVDVGTRFPTAFAQTWFVLPRENSEFRSRFAGPGRDGEAACDSVETLPAPPYRSLTDSSPRLDVPTTLARCTESSSSSP